MTDSILAFCFITALAAILGLLPLLLRHAPRGFKITLALTSIAELFIAFLLFLLIVAFKDNTEKTAGAITLGLVVAFLIIPLMGVGYSWYVFQSRLAERLYKKMLDKSK